MDLFLTFRTNSIVVCLFSGDFMRKIRVKPGCFSLKNRVPNRT